MRRNRNNLFGGLGLGLVFGLELGLELGLGLGLGLGFGYFFAGLFIGITTPIASLHARVLTFYLLSLTMKVESHLPTLVEPQ